MITQLYRKTSRSRALTLPPGSAMTRHAERKRANFGGGTAAGFIIGIWSLFETNDLTEPRGGTNFAA
jgi:hypothetical protein